MRESQKINPTIAIIKGIFIVPTVIMSTAAIVGECTQEDIFEEPVKNQFSWPGYDPSRPASEAILDYDTRTVSYSPRATPEDVKRYDHLLREKSTLKIDLNSTPEDIIMQIADQVDYYDIYDYYGGELR